MAKKSMVLKQQAKPKFSSRAYNRCKICGRPHAYLRDFGICRICFRELADGQIRVSGQGILVRKSDFKKETRKGSFLCSNGGQRPFLHRPTGSGHANRVSGRAPNGRQPFQHR